MSLMKILRGKYKMGLFSIIQSLAGQKKQNENGFWMRMDQADGTEPTWEKDPSDPKILEALNQVPSQISHLYFEDRNESGMQFLMVECENGQYRLEYDSKNLEMGLTNVLYCDKNRAFSFIQTFRDQKVLGIGIGWKVQVIR